MPPFFSIVIPTYNRGSLIAKAIDSALRQEFTDFEIIVVDDGSKDNTEEVVRSFIDSRLQYFKKQNGERGAARNYGAARAQGEYVSFFDSDDLLYPNHLAEAKKMVDRLNSPEIFHLGYDFLTDGVIISKVNNLDDGVVRKVMFSNLLSCNGVFLRKDIAREYPFHEDRVLASSEDWELWLRLIARYPLRYSNVITSTVVNHDARSLKTVSLKQIVPRDLLLISLLKSDAPTMKLYGRSFQKFVAERYTYFMLCMAEQGQKKDVFTWAWKAFRTFPLILFSPRFLVSLKKVAW